MTEATPATPGNHGAGPRLSVAMIVRDEAAAIAAAIARVRDLADGVVVVGTGSADDTAARAA
ncbi:MAG: glycosyltransferase family 2 protein, partial [Candidatus Sericytochromatia bacterium]|nr:glycosyltransferase family 2 protein [Candidatus Sericytochromatia bacterium]